MKLLAPLSLVLLFSLCGCRSNDAAKTEFSCTCGTPEAAMSGCLYQTCVDGETNPDNPDCACGTLSFGGEN